MFLLEEMVHVGETNLHTTVLDYLCSSAVKKLLFAVSSNLIKIMIIKYVLN